MPHFGAMLYSWNVAVLSHTMNLSTLTLLIELKGRFDTPRVYDILEAFFKTQDCRRENNANNSRCWTFEWNLRRNATGSRHNGYINYKLKMFPHRNASSSTSNLLIAPFLDNKFKESGNPVTTQSGEPVLAGLSGLRPYLMSQHKDSCVSIGFSYDLQHNSHTNAIEHTPSTML